MSRPPSQSQPHRPWDSPPLPRWDDEGNLVPGRTVLVPASGPTEVTATNIFEAFPYLADVGRVVIIYRLAMLGELIKMVERRIRWWLAFRSSGNPMITLSGHQMNLDMREAAGRGWFLRVVYLHQMVASITMIESNRLQDAEYARQLRDGAPSSFESEAADVVIQRVRDIGALVDECLPLHTNLFDIQVPVDGNPNNHEILRNLFFIRRLLDELVRGRDIDPSADTAYDIARILDRPLVIPDWAVDPPESPSPPLAAAPVGLPQFFADSLPDFDLFTDSNTVSNAPPHGELPGFTLPSGHSQQQVLSRPPNRMLGLDPTTHNNSSAASRASSIGLDQTGPSTDYTLSARGADSYQPHPSRSGSSNVPRLDLTPSTVQGVRFIQHRTPVEDEEMEEGEIWDSDEDMDEDDEKYDEDDEEYDADGEDYGEVRDWFADGRP
jgi:hypothetical protein